MEEINSNFSKLYRKNQSILFIKIIFKISIKKRDSDRRKDGRSVRSGVAEAWRRCYPV